MANYLKTLPMLNKQSVQFEPAEKDVMLRGGRIYEKHCANCHGDTGEGVAGVYPSLHANRAVNMQNTNNLIRIIVEGGFAPVTEKNPRPYGMPPMGHVLSDRDIADVLTFVRQSFQNHAAILSELDVMQARD
jgi:mono/diheme cytochrome c family protein